MLSRVGQYALSLRGSFTRGRLRLVEIFEPSCDWSGVGERILAEVDTGKSWLSAVSLGERFSFFGRV